VLPREILELQYRQLTINHYRLTDNQSSSPALTFPNVPDDFCPTGNWQNVFQVFIDEVLTNGTINVPGLGDVTPAQVAQINEDLADQQSQISALDTRVDTLETTVAAIPTVKVRYGTQTGIAAGDTTSIGITFSSPLPSAVYGISLTPIYGSGTPLTTPLFTIVSQNASGFTIRVDNNIAEITSLNWLAVHTSQP
jgi:hypothetical protein